MEFLRFLFITFMISVLRIFYDFYCLLFFFFFIHTMYVYTYFMCFHIIWTFYLSLLCVKGYSPFVRGFFGIKANSGSALAYLLGVGWKGVVNFRSYFYFAEFLSLFRLGTFDLYSWKSPNFKLVLINGDLNILFA